MSDVRSFKNILNHLNIHHFASDFLLKKNQLNFHHLTSITRQQKNLTKLTWVRDN